MACRTKEKYLGRPCECCGGELRYRGDCIECKKRRSAIYARSYRGREKQKRYYENYRSKRRIELLYGITREHFDSIVAKQNNCCPICNKVAKLVVDHCHITGKFRGAICHNCNTALGLACDNPEILEKAAAYLKDRR